jgi:hypothetical protein
MPSGNVALTPPFPQIRVMSKQNSPEWMALLDGEIYGYISNKYYKKSLYLLSLPDKIIDNFSDDYKQKYENFLRYHNNRSRKESFESPQTKSFIKNRKMRRRRNKTRKN